MVLKSLYAFLTLEFSCPWRYRIYILLQVLVAILNTCNYFDNNKNTVYVLGHKYTQTQFNPHLAARAKMTLSQAQNIFTPVNINCICFITRLHRTRTVSVWPLSSFLTMVLKWYHYFNWKNYPRWHALKCRMSKKKKYIYIYIYISMSQKLTSTFTNHFKMSIRLNKWRISCEGIFSQNIIRMRAWNSASCKKNKSYRLFPAAVYWYLNSHVTTEEFWERCFSSCHERGTNKKFWVPTRNRSTRIRASNTATRSVKCYGLS